MIHLNELKDIKGQVNIEYSVLYILTGLTEIKIIVIFGVYFTIRSLILDDFLFCVFDLV